MEINKVNLVYFSPTGTTRKVLESIAEGIAADEVVHVDLTLLEGAGQAVLPFSDDLVIIGAPVYGGRLPVDAIKRFEKLKADGTPAIIVVLYGNREFEDALLELRNLAIDLGFIPVAGGAFIGEHSFSSKDLPVASGRPDNLDVRKAMDFGAKIRKKITAHKSADARSDLEIPGRFPYEGGARPMTVSPVTREDTCILCGTCAGVCPKAAVSVNGSVATDIKLCIRCSSCVKNCPTDARVWDDEMIKTIATWLNENCAARKEPRVFGVDS
jgi:ferredoxin/flavodoxin